MGKQFIEEIEHEIPTDLLARIIELSEACANISVRKQRPIRTLQDSNSKIRGAFPERDYPVALHTSFDLYNELTETPWTEAIVRYYHQCFILLLTKLHLALRYDDVDIETFSFNIFDVITQLQRMKTSVVDYLYQHDHWNVWESLAEEMMTGTMDTFQTILKTIFTELQSMNIFEYFEYVNTLYIALLGTTIKTGQVYTPLTLSDFMGHFTEKYCPQTFANEEPINIIDPSCGTGSLLIKYYEQQWTREQKISVEHIYGIDIDPVAVQICKSNLLLLQLHYNLPLTEPPIFCADTLFTQALLRQNEHFSRHSLNRFFTTLAYTYEMTVTLFNIDYKIRFNSERLDTWELTRELFKRQLNDALRGNTDDISLSSELMTLLNDIYPLPEALLEMVCDQICAFLLLQSTKFTIVLGNPPYVRTHDIQPFSRKKLFETHFVSAKGHYDLAYLFLDLGIDLLAPNGTLLYLTSANMFHTDAARALRIKILSEAHIERLIELNNNFCFQNRSVLTSILILTKNTHASEETPTFPYLLLEQQNERERMPYHYDISMRSYIAKYLTRDEPYEMTIGFNNRVILAKQQTKIIRESDGYWSMLTKENLKIVSMIEQRATHTLDELATYIGVGIKTKSNTMFTEFTEADLEGHYLRESRQRVEAEFHRPLFYPYLKGKEIKAYQIQTVSEDGPKYVLYPHYKRGTKVHPYPINVIKPALEYLLIKYYKYVKKIQRICKNSTIWYNFIYPNDPDNMLTPYKLVVPDINRRNSFALDTKRHFIDGSACIIHLRANTEDAYYYYLGLLNSAVSEFYYKHRFGYRIKNGVYRYQLGNLKTMPLIAMEECPERLRTRIIRCARELSAIYEEAIENELNYLVFELYKMSTRHVRKTILSFVEDSRT